MVAASGSSFDVVPETPLSVVIRERLGLSRAKYGGGMAVGGACPLSIDRAPTRSVFAVATVGAR